jgi:hypothetical protein
VAVVSTGTGFCKASATDPDAVALATLTALMVAESLLGRAAGAVYSPAALMVPDAALPPATPLTCQETTVLVVPLTVAENCAVPFKRVADGPETRTVIWGDVPPVLFDPCEQPTIVLSVKEEIAKADSRTRAR